MKSEIYMRLIISSVLDILSDMSVPERNEAINNKDVELFMEGVSKNTSSMTKEEAIKFGKSIMDLQLNDDVEGVARYVLNQLGEHVGCPLPEAQAKELAGRILDLGCNGKTREFCKLCLEL